MISLPILSHPSAHCHSGAMAAAPDVAASPVLTSPKRKREDLIQEQRAAGAAKFRDLPRSVFSFQPPDAAATGTWSPRTKMAAQLKDLALGGDGGAPGPGASPSRTRRTSQQGSPRPVVARVRKGGSGNNNNNAVSVSAKTDQAAIFDFSGGKSANTTQTTTAERIEDQTESHDSEANAARKRLRQFTEEAEAEAVDQSKNRHDDDAQVPATPATELCQEEQGKGQTNQAPSLEKSEEQGSLSSQPEAGACEVATPPPTTPVRRKRTGTPPPSASRKSRGASSSRNATASSDDDDELVIVDPVRAALTWHEDEITVYDPEDQDDDGTGVNGIGFKPSPAVAYRRALTRRQQLADYRRREASEARRQRNERRREQVGGGGQLQRRHSMVHVHFSEAEPATVSVA